MFLALPAQTADIGDGAFSIRELDEHVARMRAAPGLSNHGYALTIAHRVRTRVVAGVPHTFTPQIAMTMRKLCRAVTSEVNTCSRIC